MLAGGGHCTALLSQINRKLPLLPTTTLLAMAAGVKIKK